MQTPANMTKWKLLVSSSMSMALSSSAMVIGLYPRNLIGNGFIICVGEVNTMKFSPINR